MQKKAKRSGIIGLLLLAFFLLLFMVIYKTQIKTQMSKNVVCTLASEHKTNGTVVLSKNMPAIGETFLCTVPDLKKIVIECQAADIEADAMLYLSVVNADTGEEYYQESGKVKALIGTKTKKLTMDLGAIKDSE